ncbi:MAG TPA: DUF92 domain-containing protein [Anaerolineae bacterium]|nr:DUF92 domain-containing protein [Anaerolineae bacterium]
MNPWQWLLGFGLGFIIAALAHAAGALSRSGMFAAILVGGITFGAGGLIPGVLLILFFVSSSVLSRLGRRRKHALHAKFAKGGRRDLGQVFANGLIAAGMALLFGIWENELWLVGLAGALAASNADTWSTELGILSRSKPRLITTWTEVEPGTSGGVTALGTAAAAAGAAIVAIAGGVMGEDIWLAISATCGGVVGAIVDSLLGASVQAIYYCPACESETERHPLHRCGTRTQSMRGWRWLNNDGVNFTASLSGALVAMGIWFLGTG